MWGGVVLLMAVLARSASCGEVETQDLIESNCLEAIRVTARQLGALQHAVKDYANSKTKKAIEILKNVASENKFELEFGDVNQSSKAANLLDESDPQVADLIELGSLWANYLEMVNCEEYFDKALLWHVWGAHRRAVANALDGDKPLVKEIVIAAHEAILPIEESADEETIKSQIELFYMNGENLIAPVPVSPYIYDQKPDATTRRAHRKSKIRRARRVVRGRKGKPTKR